MPAEMPKKVWGGREQTGQIVHGRTKGVLYHAGKRARESHDVSEVDDEQSKPEQATRNEDMNLSKRQGDEG